MGRSSGGTFKREDRRPAPGASHAAHRDGALFAATGRPQRRSGRGDSSVPPPVCASRFGGFGRQVPKRDRPAHRHHWAAGLHALTSLRTAFPGAMYRMVSPRVDDVLHMVRQSVEAFFRERDARRPAPSTRLVRIAVRTSTGSTTGSSDSCMARLETAAGTTCQATFRVRHVGGNVYDVEGRVEDGPPEVFTCCLPDAADVPVAHRLGRLIGRFLIRGVRNRQGQHAEPRGRNEDTDRPPPRADDAPRPRRSSTDVSPHSRPDGAGT